MKFVKERKKKMSKKRKKERTQKVNKYIYICSYV